MSTQVLRRVLVALDAGEPSAAALEAAARLAAELGAELVGLFVEDAELLAAVALPTGRLITSQGGAGSGADAAAMQRALRVRSASSRRAVEGAARRWRVRWSYQVTRGAVTECLLASVEEADLLTCAAAVRGRLAGRGGPTPALRDLARAAAGAVWLMHPQGLTRPLLLVYEGSERALAVALAVSRALGGRLRVNAAGDSVAAAEERAGAARAWLAEHAPGHPVEVVASIVGAAGRTLGVTRPQLVVVERSGAAATALDPLLDELGCSLLVVG